MLFLAKYLSIQIQSSLIKSQKTVAYFFPSLSFGKNASPIGAKYSYSLFLISRQISSVERVRLALANFTCPFIRPGVPTSLRCSRTPLVRGSFWMFQKLILHMAQSIPTHALHFEFTLFLKYNGEYVSIIIKIIGTPDPFFVWCNQK